MTKPLVPNGSFCMNCGVNTSEIGEYYMLRDEVWHKVVPDVLGMLCIECVEGALRRKLRPRDFDPAWKTALLKQTRASSDLLLARVWGGPSQAEILGRGD